jgi:hypothetical protein
VPCPSSAMSSGRLFLDGALASVARLRFTGTFSVKPCRNRGNDLASNGNQSLNWLSQPRGQAHFARKGSFGRFKPSLRKSSSLRRRYVTPACDVRKDVRKEMVPRTINKPFSGLLRVNQPKRHHPVFTALLINHEQPQAIHPDNSHAGGPGSSPCAITIRSSCATCPRVHYAQYYAHALHSRLIRRY